MSVNKTEAVSMTADQALFLASCPSKASNLITDLADKLGTSVGPVLLWIWGHRTQFLQIAVEAAAGDYTKALADFVALFTSGQ